MQFYGHNSKREATQQLKSNDNINSSADPELLSSSFMPYHSVPCVYCSVAPSNFGAIDDELFDMMKALILSVTKKVRTLKLTVSLHFLHYQVKQKRYVST